MTVTAAHARSVDGIPTEPRAQLSTDLRDEPMAGSTWSVGYKEDLDEAARIIGPLWPLGTAIAVNPLWDLRQLQFPQAMALLDRIYRVSGYPQAAFLEHSYSTGRITDSDLVKALELLDQAPMDARPDSIRRLLHDGASMLTPSEHYDAVHGTRLASEVDEMVAAWCAAFAGGILPDRTGLGFYQSWRAGMQRGYRIRRRLGARGRSVIRSLDADAAMAAQQCLSRLGVPANQRVAVLAAHLVRMPGWAGHAKWRSNWAPEGCGGPVIDLVNYMAVRLAIETALLMAAVPDSFPGSFPDSFPGPIPIPRLDPAPAPVTGTSEHPNFHTASITSPNPYAHPASPASSSNEPVSVSHSLPVQAPSEADLPARLALPTEVSTRLANLPRHVAAEVWLLAYEVHWYKELLDRLAGKMVNGDNGTRGAGTSLPDAQAVFCIDVRSEGIRRHLESVGPYETFGFAGFFALPLRFHAWGAEDAFDTCPVLLQPTTHMAEQPANGMSKEAWRSVAGQQARVAFGKARESAHHGTVAPFMLAEAGGFFAVPLAVARTLAPRAFRRARDISSHLFTPPVPASITADPALGALSDDDKATYAESTLVAMGLTSGFAPVILLCGHGATSENNPYASALDCGACGGNRGASSARSAAAIFNMPETRYRLAGRGIDIPPETLFVAAEHDTVTDHITILDRHLVPASFQPRLDRLEADLETAGKLLAAERAESLPGRQRRDGPRSARTSATDWAQVRPEWALARNAAFIVGPRNMTAGIDLERRVFLHSYDSSIDKDGSALETILTAPMVVAHWINAQYYFSAVAPEVFSSGDKTIHNVVAGIGVLRGAGGDLGVGLPLQSLFEGKLLYHEPMRLLVIVEAPLDRIDKIIACNPVLLDLFDGRWVHLIARNGAGTPWMMRHPGGKWDAAP